LLARQEEAYEVNHALIHTYAHQQLTPSSEIIVKLATYYEQEIEAHASDFAHLHPLRPHIMALLPIAKERKLWDVVSSLAWGIDTYLNLQGYWTDRITAITLNLAAAQATQNRRDEGALLGNLGNAYLNLDQVKQAITSYQQASTIAKEIGNRRGEGNQLGGLGPMMLENNCTVEPNTLAEQIR
jgi:tetratricopeptide (TPR) repeat protein